MTTRMIEIDESEETLIRSILAEARTQTREQADRLRPGSERHAIFNTRANRLADIDRKLRGRPARSA